MCESAYVPQRPRPAIPRPRWSRLYGVVLLGVAGLTVADVAAPAVARPSLEIMVVLVTFVGIALWAGRNRAALDQQAWCDCAAATITVRVIPSRRAVRVWEVSGVGMAVVVGPEAATPAGTASAGSVIEKERPARVFQHAGCD